MYSAPTRSTLEACDHDDAAAGHLQAVCERVAEGLWPAATVRVALPGGAVGVFDVLEGGAFRLVRREEVAPTSGDRFEIWHRRRSVTYRDCDGGTDSTVRAEWRRVSRPLPWDEAEAFLTAFSRAGETAEARRVDEAATIAREAREARRECQTEGHVWHRNPAAGCGRCGLVDEARAEREFWF